MSSLPFPVSRRPVTKRERQILQLMAEGYSRKEVAQELGVHVNTVRNRLYLMRQFYAGTNEALMVIAVKLGWISIEVEVA
jgi:DNA-binding CsgD family transcriptional regulator